jgi:hypothetical protein
VGATFVYLPERKTWINLAQVTDARPYEDGKLIVSMTGQEYDDSTPCYHLTGEDRKVMEAALNRCTMKI